MEIADRFTPRRVDAASRSLAQSIPEATESAISANFSAEIFSNLSSVMALDVARWSSSMDGKIGGWMKQQQTTK